MPIRFPATLESIAEDLEKEGDDAKNSAPAFAEGTPQERIDEQAAKLQAHSDALLVAARRVRGEAE